MNEGGDWFCLSIAGLEWLSLKWREINIIEAKLSNNINARTRASTRRFQKIEQEVLELERKKYHIARLYSMTFPSTTPQLLRQQM